jgi:hypothetical protein
MPKRPSHSCQQSRLKPAVRRPALFLSGRRCLSDSCTSFSASPLIGNGRSQIAPAKSTKISTNLRNLRTNSIVKISSNAMASAGNSRVPSKEDIDKMTVEEFEDYMNSLSDAPAPMETASAEQPTSLGSGEPSGII